MNVNIESPSKKKTGKKITYGQKPKPESELDFNPVDVLVMDMGSGYIKAGFAGEDGPRVQIRSCLSGDDSTYIGNECFEVKKYNSSTYRNLKWPLANGKISTDANMDMVEKLLTAIWHHPKMDTSSDTQPMLIGEAIGNPKEHRKKLAEVLFEKHRVPELYFGFQPVLSMYSTGNTSGLCLDIGHNLIQSVPIYEGFGLDHAVLRYEVGGSQITSYLRTMLMNKLKDQGKMDVLNFTSIQGLQYIELIKQDLGSVSMDFDDSLEKDEVVEYILPDRKRIKLNSEIYKVGECLFQPSLLNKPTIPGIDDIIEKSYNKCDDHVRKIIRSNIVLSGGSSKFKGIVPRLKDELEQRGLSNPTIHAPREREISTWVGGSMLGSLKTFSLMTVSKQQYENDGDRCLFSFF